METEKSFTDSKIIRKISYAPQSHIMTIEYVTGKIYDYHAVPQEDWNDALTAESIGKFVNNRIKGVFEYEQVI